MGAFPAMARHLVLSDIHANLTALEAVLEAAGQWDDVLCLGDLVGYGPDPNEVVDRLRTLGARTVRGNHDRVAAGLADAEEFNAAARMAIEWTRKQLRPDLLSYLRQLPPGPVECDGLILVHGAGSLRGAAARAGTGDPVRSYARAGRISVAGAAAGRNADRAGPLGNGGGSGTGSLDPLFHQSRLGGPAAGRRPARGLCRGGRCFARGVPPRALRYRRGAAAHGGSGAAGTTDSAPRLRPLGLQEPC